MKDEKILRTLIYCHRCYGKNNTESENRLYIGECMHILCQSCFTKTDSCTVCHAICSFIILDAVFISKLLKNPTESFNEPIESCMFQLSSAMNLIIHQKSEINRLRSILRRAKDELTRIKTIKRNQNKSIKDNNPGLFNFKNVKNEERIKAEENNIKKVIDGIYYKDKSINSNIKILNVKNAANQSTTPIKSEVLSCLANNKQRKEPTKNGNILLDITNKGKKKYFTAYDPTKHSFSTSKSSRITLPKKDSEFKYVYRRQGGF